MLRKMKYEKMKERIKELLEEGLTVAVIAERLGCKPSFIYKIRRRKGGD